MLFTPLFQKDNYICSAGVFYKTMYGKQRWCNQQTNCTFKAFNIASGSEANMTTLCEMEFFDFLWLILVHYLPLPPT